MLILELKGLMKTPDIPENQSSSQYSNFLSFCTVFVCIVIFQQLGLEREHIKVQANLEAEMNMRNQANSAKADMESMSRLSVSDL